VTWLDLPTACGHPAADEFGCIDVVCYVDRLDATVKVRQAERIIEITDLLVRP
jgi:hypothetical protein